MSDAAALATIVSAIATAVLAAVSGLSVALLWRQVGDARRFGAAPALHALLTELDEQLAGMRRLGPMPLDAAGEETVGRMLDWWERIEHLRDAGVLPADVLARAFGPALRAQLADARVRAMLDAAPDEHREVLRLAGRLG